VKEKIIKVRELVRVKKEGKVILKKGHSVPRSEQEKSNEKG